MTQRAALCYLLSGTGFIFKYVGKPEATMYVFGNEGAQIPGIMDPPLPQLSTVWLHFQYASARCSRYSAGEPLILLD